MTYSIKEETFDSLSFYWRQAGNTLKWDCFFVLPVWLKAWWGVFGRQRQPFLYSFWEGGELLGLAPLMVEEGRALFMGDPNVCDCQDFVVASGKEEVFFNAFLDEIERQPIKELDLSTLRPDSNTILYFLEIAKERGYRPEQPPDGVSMEMNLPETWEEYLGRLGSKHRHETRRKLRRLEETAGIHYRVVEDPQAVEQETETFLRLFRMSRPDKTDFLNQEMESFFRSLMKIMSENGVLRLCWLDIDHEPAAAVLCFDFNETILLYNNGFNPAYSGLSAGLLSKVLSIKDSIARGRKKYDFLKGNEKYKRHLGGKEIPLFRCRILLDH